MREDMLPSTTLNNCLACGNSFLGMYLDLGKQPMANNLIPIGNNKTAATNIHVRRDLAVNFCMKCSHSQLSCTVSPEKLFKDYKYVSGTTKTLKAHFQSLTDYLLGQLYPIKDNISVLDIGCNDGTLLEEFERAGAARTIGVDPAQTMREVFKLPRENLITDFWSKSSDLGEKFDIITGCNVFAHNLDPYGFLEACKKHLKPHGIIAIEMPYGVNTFRENQFDQIYHEHVSYFNVKSFTTLTNRAGLGVHDFRGFPIHGGSICFVLGHQQVNDYPVDGQIEKERELGLTRYETYLQFAERSRRNVREFAQFLNDNAERREIIAYGAAAKMTVTLGMIDQFASIEMPKIHTVIDDNPAKHGYITHYTYSEILGSEELKKYWEEPVLMPVFSWNFLDEIKERLAGQTNITLCTYVPHLKVIPIT